MAVGQPLRARQRLGKYRIEARLARGGFADVYRAYDTLEGIRVALKLPRPDAVADGVLEGFRREARLTARLEHENILPIKNADFIEDHFVIAYPLGDESLGDRLTRRISMAKRLDYAEQVLAGLGFAHGKRVLHGDVKPDNFILFGDHLRLSDFGVSRVALRTLHASGTGTIGYMAPEQALGRPSLRSDVFAAGLVLCRLLTGVLPEWPFEWPPRGVDRARQSLHPQILELIERSLRVSPRARPADCQVMLNALQGVRSKALRYARGELTPVRSTGSTDWRAVQLRTFRRTHQRSLEAHHACRRCQRPVSESMKACPWCAASRTVFREETRYPAACPRCKRGVKLDWRYCPHCHGKAIGPVSNRSYTDKRYSARCAHSHCRGVLMPFMKYCPWCRAKVARAWKIEGSRDRCSSCGWGVLADFWAACPWCASALEPGRGKAKRVRGGQR